MKQRFSSLDVKVIAHELSSILCGLRVANCYDLSSRIFLFKFHRPGQREQLVIDSGFRCHLTSYARTTAAQPSAFVAKLRRHLSTRRVTAVAQVGTDRVIEFAFSDGMYRLFLEFYAGGNIVLCDRDLKVLTLLRRVPAGAGEEEIREGMTYGIEGRQNFHGAPKLTLELLRNSLQTHVEKASKEAPAKKSKRKQGDVLRRALTAAVPEFPPVLIDHAFKVRHFDASISPEDVLKDDDKLQRLLDVLEEAKQQSNEVVASTPCKGYIIAKPAKQRRSDQTKSTEGSDGDKENIALVYDDFHPFKPKQLEDVSDNTVIEISGFNKAVDDFFSSLESQKLESRLTERELTAQRKIDSARADHEKRIGGLQQVQELNVRKAQALEANLQRVEEATAAVNGLIAQGMDWEDIAALITTEKARQNPVATIIKLPLKLHENTVTLMLGEEEQADDELGFADESQSEASEDEAEDMGKENQASNQSPKDDKLLSIDVDLALTAWANAGQYYDQKRTAAVKEEKTVQASEEALKRHEKKVHSDLKKGLAQEKKVLRSVRQQLWFEKFFYFVSSEGYLVLGAKDKTQSDMLYKRHLNKGDVWVHANLEGASHVVVKNRPGLHDSPIPPSTLAQAGTFCVCTSEAWDSKAIMGAWWVNMSQVSKLAPNGDFLGLGSFEIKGDKNHLPPAQLLLGFGVMFKLSESSLAKRNKKRVPLGDVTQHDDAAQKVEENSEEDDDVASTGHVDKESLQNEEEEADIEGGQEEDERAGQEHVHYQNPLQSQVTDAEESQDDGKKDESEDEEGSDKENPTATKAEDDEQAEDQDKEADQEADEADEEAPDTADDASVAAESTTTATSNAASKTAPQVRGKHGKKAKIKSKYAWQDDEDRALALRLLGSVKGQEKKANDAEEKAAKEAADAAAKERRREQHRIAQQKGKEAEEARQRRLAGEAAATTGISEAADGGQEEEVVEEEENLAVTESYVGLPKPGDEIEDFLVVCAPWDAMGPRFRWRTKIQPGTQKKGKAVKEILGSWLHDVNAREKKRMPHEEDDRWAEEKMLRREGELLKGIRDVEVVGCLPIRSGRVVVSGGDSARGGGGRGGGAGRGKGAKSGAKGGRGGKGSKKK